MVVSPELLTVVTPAHQVPPAASVPVIDPSITSTVTVPLTLPARLLRGAAPPPVIVPAPAPLARGRRQGGPWHYDWGLGKGQVLGQVTAVILTAAVKVENKKGWNFQHMALSLEKVGQILFSTLKASLRMVVRSELPAVVTATH